MSPGAYAGPSDPVRRQEWRRARRVVLKQHHPDLGGDAQELARRLAQVDADYRRAEQPTTPPLIRRPRRVRTLTRTLRARIPAGWPGHRRRIEL